MHINGDMLFKLEQCGAASMCRLSVVQVQLLWTIFMEPDLSLEGLIASTGIPMTMVNRGLVGIEKRLSLVEYYGSRDGYRLTASGVEWCRLLFK